MKMFVCHSFDNMMLNDSYLNCEMLYIFLIYIYFFNYILCLYLTEPKNRRWKNDQMKISECVINIPTGNAMDNGIRQIRVPASLFPIIC